MPARGCAWRWECEGDRPSRNHRLEPGRLDSKEPKPRLAIVHRASSDGHSLSTVSRKTCGAREPGSRLAPRAAQATSRLDLPPHTGRVPPPRRLEPAARPLLARSPASEGRPGVGRPRNSAYAAARSSQAERRPCSRRLARSRPARVWEKAVVRRPRRWPSPRRQSYIGQVRRWTDRSKRPGWRPTSGLTQRHLGGAEMTPSHRSASSRRTQTSVSAIMPSSPPIPIAPAGSGPHTTRSVDRKGQPRCRL